MTSKYDLPLFDADFGQWAFGKRIFSAFTQGKKDGLSLMRSWNRRHGDKLKLHPEGLIKDDFARMYDLYVDHVNMAGDS